MTTSGLPFSVLILVSTSTLMAGAFKNFTKGAFPNRFSPIPIGLGRSSRRSPLFSSASYPYSSFSPSLSSTYSGPNTVLASALKRNIEKGGPNYKLGARDSVAAMGEARVDLDFHLDMRAFLKKVDKIPNLENLIMDLFTKIDDIRGSIIQEIDARVGKLESSINAKVDIILDKIQYVVEIATSVQQQISGIEQGIVNIINIIQDGQGGGYNCDLGPIEIGINQITILINDLMKLTRRISDDDALISQDIRTIINTVQENFSSLRILINMINQSSGQGGQCEGIIEIEQKETQILEGIFQIVNSMGDLPNQVVVIIERTGLGGLGVLIQQVLEICSQIQIDLTVVNDFIHNLGDKLAGWIQSQSKSVEMIKTTVTETTEVVRAQARQTEAAVRMASRRCN